MPEINEQYVANHSSIDETDMNRAKSRYDEIVKEVCALTGTAGDRGYSVMPGKSIRIGTRQFKEQRISNFSKEVTLELQDAQMKEELSQSEGAASSKLRAEVSGRVWCPGGLAVPLGSAGGYVESFFLRNMSVHCPDPTQDRPCRRKKWPCKTRPAKWSYEHVKRPEMLLYEPTSAWLKFIMARGTLGLLIGGGSCGEMGTMAFALIMLRGIHARMPDHTRHLYYVAGPNHTFCLATMPLEWKFTKQLCLARASVNTSRTCTAWHDDKGFTTYAGLPYVEYPHGWVIDPWYFNEKSPCDHVVNWTREANDLASNPEKSTKGLLVGPFKETLQLNEPLIESIKDEWIAGQLNKSMGALGDSMPNATPEEEVEKKIYVATHVVRVLVACMEPSSVEEAEDKAEQKIAREISLPLPPDPSMDKRVLEKMHQRHQAERVLLHLATELKKTLKRESKSKLRWQDGLAEQVAQMDSKRKVDLLLNAIEARYSESLRVMFGRLHRGNMEPEFDEFYRAQFAKPNGLHNAYARAIRKLRRKYDVDEVEKFVKKFGLNLARRKQRPTEALCYQALTMPPSELQVAHN